MWKGRGYWNNTQHTVVYVQLRATYDDLVTNGRGAYLGPIAQLHPILQVGNHATPGQMWWDVGAKT